MSAEKWDVQWSETHGWAVGAYIVVPASGIHDRSVVFRLGRRCLTLYRLRDGQPWPEVDECFSKFEPGHVCPQHDPRHEHTWASGKPWHDWSHQVPVRCVVCGGRKCDMPRCIRIRHHTEDHSDWLGYNGKVGASA